MPLTIAQLSDLHCGSPHFVPDLMERAIARDQRAEPRHRRLLGRPDDLRLQGGVRRGEALPRPDRVRCVRRHPRQPRLAQRRLRPLRGAVRRPKLRRCAGSGVDGRRRRLDRARPRPRPDRPRPLRLDRGASSRASRPSLRVFVLHHHLLPIPGTGRERNVVYDAGDAIECLQRADVHLVLSGHKHVPYAWKLENLFVVNTGTVSTLRLRGTHAALLQRDRGRGHARLGLAPLPVPRAGADHPVRHRDRRVREVHRPDRARGDDETVSAAVALIDGEHYAPVVRDALAALPYEWVGAILVGGTEKLRDGADYGVPLVDDFAGAELVVDLSDEPVLGPAERFRWASRALAPGCRTSAPTSGSTRRSSSRSSCRRSRSSARASASARPRSRLTSPGCSRATATSSSSRWAGAGPPSPRWSSTPPTVAELVALAAQRAARRLRSPRDRGALRRADDRLPPGGRRARRRGLHLERRGGRATRG